LEALAQRVRSSGTDTKWLQLSSILQDAPEMFDAAGSRRKLVIFTEHRDTLEYLAERLRTSIGKPEAVVTIRGGMNRETRKAAEHAFKNDPAVSILVATDAVRIPRQSGHRFHGNPYSRSTGFRTPRAEVVTTPA
jgi:superfamily II DNA/RNA helicase